jgi:hypothetical protein
MTDNEQTNGVNASGHGRLSSSSAPQRKRLSTKHPSAIHRRGFRDHAHTGHCQVVDGCASIRRPPARARRTSQAPGRRGHTYRLKRNPTLFRMATRESTGIAGPRSNSRAATPGGGDR